MTEQEIRNNIILAKKEKIYTFQWHITHKCNLRCRHCYLDEYAVEPTEIELLTVLGRIVQFLNERDAKSFICVTGGEPLASPAFFQLMNWLENEPRIIEVIIGSNGTILDEENVKLLKKYKKLRAIQISIDGIKETHDSIRGEGNFDKAIEGLKLLAKHKIWSSVSFTANKLNYREFIEVAKITEDTGGNVCWTDRVIPLGDDNKKADINKNLILDEKEFCEYIEIIKEAKEKYKCARAERTLQYLAIEESKNLRHICAAGKRGFTITADCELMPCRRLEENYGSVLEKPISQILEEHKEDILKIHTIPDGCKNCGKVEICKGGAKCLTCAIFGDYNHPDPNCTFYKEA
jgi:radical SAM protein with 4Fe4S-binding SPASM domain